MNRATGQPAPRGRGASAVGTKFSLAQQTVWSITTRGLLALTAMVDFVPPHVRFGHLQRFLGLLRLRDGLPVVPAHSEPCTPDGPAATQLHTVRERDLTCALVAGSLDTGGIEAVVAALSGGLPGHGLQPTVVCSSPGRTAETLRRDGVEVVHAPTARDLLEFLRARRPDVVQLHRAEQELTHAVRESGLAATPVFHAIETYLDAATWRELGRLVDEQPVAVAVSSSVKDFVSSALSMSLPMVQVIVNGSRPPTATHEADRSHARSRVGEVLNCDLHDDTVVVSLSRFTDQKNVPGLVDAFLDAARDHPPLRLIVAGEPQNWLEVRRADSLRRGHPAGCRVHLLGTSGSAVLLKAADLFVLNSLAEGGPLAAVEAAAYGLPLVLSDVGFARQLVACDEVQGVVVSRANEKMTPRSLARARRSRVQRNRMELSQALLRMSHASRPPAGMVPDMFSESAMVAAHGQVLRSVAKQRRARGQSGAGRG